MGKKQAVHESSLHKLRPIHRVIISLLVGSGIFFATNSFELTLVIHLLIGWLAFCVCYLSLCWIVIYTTLPDSIRKKAAIEDGSRTFVFLFILIACFACLWAVLSIIVNAKGNDTSPYLTLPVSIASMVFSWLLVHTIYIFHYAHLYYHEGSKGMGLHFPGEENNEEPDYLDFAYFSLGLGSTFQVSDVEIISKRIRVTAMYHGLISFGLNTFVVALTINIVSGLIN